ncbi:hypothetical protein [Actinokineospora iranica]|uniref:DUF3558 domain-containing protein n=1 Tax=Actinokineospora iranica TaxID=1271860 RepID=A0A1G6U940_9PSEU|nr:hypothetical protein [Actinokineospora iranica]SDD37107.1 hypothetical protein SAMN05216174_110139 [Actinokineospora iranica]
MTNNRLRRNVALLGLLLAAATGGSACGNATPTPPGGSTAPATTTAASQGGGDIPIATPKKVLKPSECKGLLTAADVQPAVGFPTSPDEKSSSASHCRLSFQESTVFNGAVGVTLTLDDSEPSDRVIDIAGNHATERDENGPALHECSVRVRVARVPKEQPGGTLLVTTLFWSEAGRAKDVCAITRALAKTAFDRIPNA